MISMITAADLRNGIGFDSNLLCRLDDDMRFFISKTKDKPVIMGYKTFASMGFKPLKGRFNIVLTNSPIAMTAEHMELLQNNTDLVFENLEFVQFMIEQSLETEFMVIGGQKIYELFLPMADQIYLTRIAHEFELVDTHFPQIDFDDWYVEPVFQGEKNNHNEHSFTTYRYTRKVPHTPETTRFEKAPLPKEFSTYQGELHNSKEE